MGAFDSKKWDYDHHVVPPVSHSTAFRLTSLERGAKGFVQFASADEALSGHMPIYIYDRLDEPTRAMLEENLAYAEGGEVCVTFATRHGCDQRGSGCDDSPGAGSPGAPHCLRLHLQPDDQLAAQVWHAVQVQRLPETESLPRR